MQLLVKRFARNKSALAGLIIVLIVACLALFSRWMAPYDPIDQFKGYSGVAPGTSSATSAPQFGYEPSAEESTHIPPGGSVRFWLGSDIHGRDILSRIIYGSRVSLLVGVVAELISVLIGVTIGSIAGYFGGWLDSALMRVTDTFYAFPPILLAIGILAIFENPGLTGIFIALGVTGWTAHSRVVRGQVLSIKEREFVEAARAVGAGHVRIIMRHIIPNCIAPIIVLGTLGVAGNVLSEAGLSFLGLGISPPAPSWGNMLAEGRNYLATKPWLCVFPGAALAITVWGFNLLGDGIRDVLDPRMKV
jgi:ABC-type dipeptide/oligopeptide/nickel transport system permease subunit